MRKLASILDRVASELEEKGLNHLALELDKVSNALEVSAGGGHEDIEEGLEILPESHVHQDIQPNVEWIKEQVKAPNSPHVIKTTKSGPVTILTLKGAPHPVKSGLYGPAAGDAPVTDDQVTMMKRGARSYESRIIKGKRMRDTNVVTVIYGPHEGHAKVLYTVYGGPEAPQEPNDPRVRDKAESEKFWSEHALTADSQ